MKIDKNGSFTNVGYVCFFANPVTIVNLIPIDKIWVKVVRPGENRAPIGVRVDSDADIDDVVCKTLEDISIKDVDRSRVTVDAGGRAIKPCEKVVTLLQQGIGTYENALLLKLPEVEGM